MGSVRIKVSKLAYKTTDKALRAAFEPFGEVLEAKVARDWETDRSRGFGHVTFADEEAAERALAQLQGATLDGKAIGLERVDGPKSKGGGARRAKMGGGRGSTRGGGGGGGFGGGGNSPFG